MLTGCLSHYYKCMESSLAKKHLQWTEKITTATLPSTNKPESSLQEVQSLSRDNMVSHPEGRLAKRNSHNPQHLGDFSQLQHIH